MFVVTVKPLGMFHIEIIYKIHLFMLTFMQLFYM